MRRVKETVSLQTARERLLGYAIEHGFGPHNAATLAGVIWPDAKFIAAQGAGAAASRVLKRLGCKWTKTKYDWGWGLFGI